jgi:hypothetical protein
MHCEGRSREAIQAGCVSKRCVCRRGLADKKIAFLDAFPNAKLHVQKHPKSRLVGILLRLAVAKHTGLNLTDLLATSAHHFALRYSAAGGCGGVRPYGPARSDDRLIGIGSMARSPRWQRMVFKVKTTLQAPLTFALAPSRQSFNAAAASPSF